MKPEKIYTRYEGTQLHAQGLIDPLRIAIEKYGTVICLEDPRYSVYSNHWKALSKVELLILIGRRVPIYTLNMALHKWQKVKL